MDYSTLLVSSLTPIGYMVSAILVFHFARHSASYTLRFLLLFPFLYLGVLSFFNSSKFLLPNLTSLWAQSVALNIVQITSYILIENHPAPPSRSILSILRPSAFLTTWRIWSNPQQLPEVRKAASKGAPPAHLQESKSVFIFLRLAKLSLYYCIDVHILPSLFSETIVEIFPPDVSETALFSRLRDVSAREVVVRSYMAMVWIWESVVFLDGANAVLSLMGVLAGIDTPADWPTMFGRLDEIRGLRSFWGKFWHRLAILPYRNCGVVVTSGISWLFEPSKSKQASVVWVQAQGMTVAFAIFLLSGLSHAAVSWQLGMRDWLDLEWFLLNFMACSVEIYAVSTVKYLAGRLGLANELRAVERSWLGRVIGYAWVFAFFFWSVPLWKFPRMHRALTAAERWVSIWSNMKVCGGDVPCI